MNRSLKVVSTPALAEQAGKSTVENCMMTILLAMSMVSGQPLLKACGRVLSSGDQQGGTPAGSDELSDLKAFLDEREGVIL